jgi:hypothetical protein
MGDIRTIDWLLPFRTEWPLLQLLPRTLIFPSSVLTSLSLFLSLSSNVMLSDVAMYMSESEWKEKASKSKTDSEGGVLGRENGVGCVGPIIYRGGL